MGLRVLRFRGFAFGNWGLGVLVPHSALSFTESARASLKEECPIPTLGVRRADLSRDRSACLDSAYAHSSPAQYDQSCKPEILPSPRAREKPAPSTGAKELQAAACAQR